MLMLKKNKISKRIICNIQTIKNNGPYFPSLAYYHFFDNLLIFNEHTGNLTKQIEII